jgi:hypothetical protein
MVVFPGILIPNPARRDTSRYVWTTSQVPADNLPKILSTKYLRLGLDMRRCAAICLDSVWIGSIARKRRSCVDRGRTVTLLLEPPAGSQICQVSLGLTRGDNSLHFPVIVRRFQLVAGV